jgi:hypothetical protein
MTLDDYIKGERLGPEAHDLELEAMRDPFLGDALDGFDAVPGDHAAAIERLAGRIAGSASGGRAAARARTAQKREGRIRGWSVAAASVFLAAAVGGGVWLLGDATGTLNPPRPAIAPVDSHEEVIEILPPVIVIGNEDAPAAAPTDPSGMKFDSDEVPTLTRDTLPDTEPVRDTVDRHEDR